MLKIHLLFSLTILALFCLGCANISKTNTSRTPSSKPQKIIFFLLDGTNESIFSEMLEAGDLPYLKKLRDGTLIESHKGIYSRSTSVWPSTTGPAYAPFLMGVYPQKSGLVGIRQYLREDGIFRSYPGSDIQKINDDLSKDYATIYEVLGDKESYNQQGFVTRRGWKKNGEAMSPKVQNMTALSGLHNKFGSTKNHVANDLRNIQAFLAHVSSRFDTSNNSIKAFTSLDEDIIDNAKFGKLNMSFTDFLERSILQGRGLGHLPLFSFIGLHAPDAVSHEVGTGEEYRNALKKVDLMIGGVVKYFTLRGEIDNITFIFSADHGTDTVGTTPEHHVPVITKLAKDSGISIQDSLKTSTVGFFKKWKKDQAKFSAIATVSGNANVQIYLKGGEKNLFSIKSSHQEIKSYQNNVNLVQHLIKYPEVSQVFTKDLANNHFYITSKDGESRIEESAEGFRYEILKGNDPMEISNPEAIEMITSGKHYSGDEWARVTKDSNYPDCIVQIVQLLKAERSGDIIFDAKKGFEPWDEMQGGLHGSLRRDHIMIPLLISSPNLDPEKAKAVFENLGRLPRSVDMYPTMLKLLNLEQPTDISFERKRKLKFWSKEKITVPVKTDIDGVSLDIWN